MCEGIVTKDSNGYKAREVENTDGFQMEKEAFKITQQRLLMKRQVHNISVDCWEIPLFHEYETSSVFPAVSDVFSQCVCCVSERSTGRIRRRGTW